MRHGGVWVLVCSISVLLLLSMTGAAAQTPVCSAKGLPTKKDYALIYGTVWGPDDHPVAGVPIRFAGPRTRKPSGRLFPIGMENLRNGCRSERRIM